MRKKTKQLNIRLIVNYVQNPDKTDCRVYSPTDLQGLLDLHL